RALAGEDADPATVATAAVAVECFHKASLIHDDIEDDDPVRYGKPAMHEALGLPVALNVGDYLLGEGYRLLSRATADPTRTADMMRVAAEGHHELCLGQGDELTWARNPRPLSVREVLNIFRRKTSPAFEVALRVGAALAGQEPQLRDALHRYSVAVGIAYQIRDDLDDGSATGPDGDLSSMRPSVLPAIALQRAETDDARLLQRVWTRRASEDDRRQLEEVLTRLDVRPIAQGMLEFHKARAIRALIGLPSVELKALLRRLVAKIFGDVETMGCCDEHSS
ncbi:MAG: polyprenyl synthetase family protein, partial [Phycisphaerae bacterium]